MKFCYNTNFSLPKQSQRSRSILQDGSRSLVLFWKEKTPSYNQRNTVSCDSITTLLPTQFKWGGHNICFHWHIRKIIFKLSLLPPLIWSSAVSSSLQYQGIKQHTLFISKLNSSQTTDISKQMFWAKGPENLLCDISRLRLHELKCESK